MTVGSWLNPAARIAGRWVRREWAIAATGTANPADPAASSGRLHQRRPDLLAATEPEADQQRSLVVADAGNEPAGQQQGGEREHEAEKQHHQDGGASGGLLSVDPGDRVGEVGGHPRDLHLVAHARRQQRGGAVE